jgi:dihydroflavonol-4-reductase
MAITSRPVLVTGAAGFIGGEITAQLLAAGYRVRASTRKPVAGPELEHLRALPGARERLELVQADLMQAGAFVRLVAGCAQVVHAASPFQLDVADPQRDLVDPAVQGTEAVLAACRQAGGVQRVVLTSSMAAITDSPEAGRALTEEDWNVTSTLRRNPYYLSKTLAERAAWRFMEQHQPGFTLVAINPWTVIGPSRCAPLNSSNALFVDLLSGVFPGIINLSFALVDVRDVALAHLRALETPAAQGRYICAAEVLDLGELVALIRAAGFDRGYKLPRLSLRSPAADLLVRLVSYTQPRGKGTFARTHLGRVPSFDNGKIRRELGMTFRDVRQSVGETVQDLARWGHLPEPRGRRALAP